MVPCKSTANEVSFEWSHHRIFSIDSNVRATLHVCIIDAGNEKVKTLWLSMQACEETKHLPTYKGL